MTPVTRKVRVRVPATSANLGSGFDTVGLALDYHDELEFTLSADPVNTAAQVMIEGEGADTLPRDETHLVVSTFRRACQTFGLGRVGFILQAHNNIPQARGMGSSAEAIVAGIAAAAAFAQDDELNRDAVFELAAASKAIRTTWLRPCTAGSPCLGTWKLLKVSVPCRFRAANRCIRASIPSTIALPTI